MELEHGMKRVNGVRLHYVTAGQGEPLVLLHGHPQSWYMWRKAIPIFAESRRVIAIDLRGYGDSDKPRGGFDKKTMASDVRELVRALGHERFALVGHDRGGRVAYRYGLEYPGDLTHLGILDIVPTGVVFDRITADAARRQWHWFFFQLQDLPELLLNSNKEGYLRWSFRNASLDPNATFSEADIQEYLRVYSIPGTIRCILEDYRAAASIDAENDRIDAKAGRKLTMPMLVLWGSEGGFRQWPVLDIWREWATNLRGEAIPDCGHYLPEEQPKVVAEKILAFLRGA